LCLGVVYLYSKSGRIHSNEKEIKTNEGLQNKEPHCKEIPSHSPQFVDKEPTCHTTPELPLSHTDLPNVGKHLAYSINVPNLYGYHIHPDLLFFSHNLLEKLQGVDLSLILYTLPFLTALVFYLANNGFFSSEGDSEYLGEEITPPTQTMLNTGRTAISRFGPFNPHTYSEAGGISSL